MTVKEVKLKIAESVQDDVNKGSVNQRCSKIKDFWHQLRWFTGLYLLDKIKVNK